MNLKEKSNRGEEFMGTLKSTRMTAVLTVLVFISLLLGWRLTSAQAGGALSIRDVQVMNTTGNTICQYAFESGAYKLAWQSADLGGRPSVRIGDIDNDGQKEIVASVYYVTRTAGKRPNIVTYYGFRICVFEGGEASGGGPSWSYTLPGDLANTIVNDSWIADVDNDGPALGRADNELVLIRSQRLEAYHYDGSTGAWTSELIHTYPSYLFSLDAGDADNLGDNEIITHFGGIPWVWKKVGSTWVNFPVDGVSPQYYGSGMTSLGLTYLRVRDADNIPGNEIIATGNNQRLMVWKYQEGAYKLTSLSQEFPSYEAYGIDAGDVGGDALNEVVISLWGTKKLPPRLVTLAYEGGIWVLKNTYSSDFIDQRDLRIGNLDGAGKAEVVLNYLGSPSGMKILGFSGADLLTGSFQVLCSASSDGASKLEIR